MWPRLCGPQGRPGPRAHLDSVAQFFLLTDMPPEPGRPPRASCPLGASPRATRPPPAQVGSPGLLSPPACVPRSRAPPAAPDWPVGRRVAEGAAPVPAPATRPRAQDGPPHLCSDGRTGGREPGPRGAVRCGAGVGTSCSGPVRPARPAPPSRKCRGPGPGPGDGPALRPPTGSAPRIPDGRRAGRWEPARV